MAADALSLLCGGASPHCPSLPSRSAQPLPRAVEERWGGGSAREHVLDDVYVDMPGGQRLTVRMQLERLQLKKYSPKARQFPTRRMLRDQTTLFSWILNSDHGWQRAGQVALHVVGVAVCPLTLTVGPFLAVAWNATEALLFPPATQTQKEVSGGTKSCPPPLQPRFLQPLNSPEEGFARG